MRIWMNGQFVEREEATVSIFNAAVQHGIGLFETLAARNGAVFRGREHMERLAGSARDLLLSERLHIDPLLEAVNATLTENDMTEARLRLTVTGGDLSELGPTGHGALDPTIFIVAQPPTPYPDELFAKGVVVMIGDGRLNPLDPQAGHKTTEYWPRIRALQIAGSRGASEAIWFTVSNHLASGSVSNIFLVKDERLLTPFARGEEEQGALTAPVLPGITRQAILEIAERQSIGVEMKMLDINDLLEADEVFLTNSSWGVLPVIGVERETIGDGRPGELTVTLRQDLLELIDHETS